MSHTILVPLDGSAESARALPTAARLADSFDDAAEIILLRVVNPDEIDVALGTSTRGYPPEASIEESAESLVKGGFSVSVASPHGSAVSGILDAAQQFQPDYMVMATHGREGFDRLLHGSIAEAVVRESRVPVLLVGPAVQTGPAPKRFLVPLDGDAFSAAALPVAARLAADLHAGMDIVGVVPTISLAFDDAEGAVPPWAMQRLELEQHRGRTFMAESQELVSARRASLELTLHGLVREQLPGASDVRVLTYYDRAGAGIAHTILRALEELGVGLIVMRTHARGGLARAWLGSVTERLVRTAPIPLLVLTSEMLAHASTPPASPSAEPVRAR